MKKITIIFLLVLVMALCISNVSALKCKDGFNDCGLEYYDLDKDGYCEVHQSCGVDCSEYRSGSENHNTEIHTTYCTKNIDRCPGSQSSVVDEDGCSCCQLVLELGCNGCEIIGGTPTCVDDSSKIPKDCQIYDAAMGYINNCTDDAALGVCSCINAECSGKNKVVYRIQNGAGAMNLKASYCPGEFTISAKGANWFSTCEDVSVSSSLNMDEWDKLEHNWYISLGTSVTVNGRPLSDFPYNYPVSMSVVDSRDSSRDPVPNYVPSLLEDEWQAAKNPDILTCDSEQCSGLWSMIQKIVAEDGGGSIQNQCCDGEWHLRRDGNTISAKSCVIDGQQVGFSSCSRSNLLCEVEPACYGSLSDISSNGEGYMSQPIVNDDLDITNKKCTVDNKDYTPCINSYCTGSNKVLFPVMNQAGMRVGYPTYCSGKFTVDTRGANWLAICNDDENAEFNANFNVDKWVEHNNPPVVEDKKLKASGEYNDWCGYSKDHFENNYYTCPMAARKTPQNSIKTTTNCYGDFCAGINNHIGTIMLGTEIFMQDRCCDGYWKADMTGVGDTFCEKDGFYSCSEISVPTMVSCTNSYCSGYNKILYGVRNKAGWQLDSPIYCKGNYVIDTREGHFMVNCGSQDKWSMLECSQIECFLIGNELNLAQDFESCPAAQYSGGQKEVNCSGARCKGKNSIIGRVINKNCQDKDVASGEQYSSFKYSCSGVWEIDATGDEISWTCNGQTSNGAKPTGGFIKGEPLDAYQCPGENDLTIDDLDINFGSCVDAYCTFEPKTLIFPTVNAAGSGSLGDIAPAYCSGKSWVDVRGANWESHCTPDGSDKNVELFEKLGFKKVGEFYVDTEGVTCPLLKKQDGTYYAVKGGCLKKYPEPAMGRFNCSGKFCTGFNSWLGLIKAGSEEENNMCCDVGWSVDARGNDIIEACGGDDDEWYSCTERIGSIESCSKEDCIFESASIVFPIENEANMHVTRPLYCSGKFIINVSGGEWKHRCTDRDTDKEAYMQKLFNNRLEFNENTGYANFPSIMACNLFPDEACPAINPKDVYYKPEQTAVECNQFSCEGVNSRLLIVKSQDDMEENICCDDDWKIFAEGNKIEKTCGATDDEWYSCSELGEIKSCARNSISGDDGGLFYGVVNAAGMHLTYPISCSGEYEIDTKTEETKWHFMCNGNEGLDAFEREDCTDSITSNVEVSVDGGCGSTPTVFDDGVFSTCPPESEPATCPLKRFECIDDLCAGFKSSVGLIKKGSKYYDTQGGEVDAAYWDENYARCNSFWEIDVRGTMPEISCQGRWTIREDDGSAPVEGCINANLDCSRTEGTSGTLIFQTSEDNSGDFLTHMGNVQNQRDGLDSFCWDFGGSDIMNCTEEGVHALVSVNCDDEVVDMPSSYGYVQGDPVYYYDVDGNIIELADSWCYMLRGYTNDPPFTDFWSGSSLTGHLAVDGLAGTYAHCDSWRTSSSNYNGTIGDEIELETTIDACNNRYPILCACIIEDIECKEDSHCSQEDRPFCIGEKAKCGQCRSGESDCDGLTTECRTYSCNENINNCTYIVKPSSITSFTECTIDDVEDAGVCNSSGLCAPKCIENSDCATNLCDADSGLCIQCTAENIDACDDGNECTTDTCNSGKCENKVLGAPSCDGGTKICDAGGNCVDKCSSDNDCDDGNECTINTCNSTLLCEKENAADGLLCSTNGHCCDGGCATGTINSDYNDTCRSSSPTCINDEWGYEMANEGTVCDGECTVCDDGYCDFNSHDECDGDLVCSYGICGESCEDECSAGQKECRATGAPAVRSCKSNTFCMQFTQFTACPDNKCAEPVCDGSECDEEYVEEGGEDEACRNNKGCLLEKNCVCDGIGNCLTECSQDSNCDDDNPCTEDYCSEDGFCINEGAEDGALCNTNGTCCAGKCHTAIGNSDYDDECRSEEPACIGGAFRYVATNANTICDGTACTKCKNGYCNFNDDKECASDSSCINGTCDIITESVCEEGDRSCHGSTHYKTCVQKSDFWVWGDLEKCTKTRACVDPECAGGGLCTDGYIDYGKTDDFCYSNVGCEGTECICNGEGKCIDKTGNIVDDPSPVASGNCNNNYICDTFENYRSCPNDCPSGGLDSYCDKISDGVCDPDCRDPSLDPDCDTGPGDEPIEDDVDSKGFNWLWLLLMGVLIIVVIAGGGFYYYYQKGDLDGIFDDKKPETGKPRSGLSFPGGKPSQAIQPGRNSLQHNPQNIPQRAAKDGMHTQAAAQPKQVKIHPQQTMNNYYLGRFIKQLRDTGKADKFLEIELAKRGYPKEYLEKLKKGIEREKTMSKFDDKKGSA